MQISDSIAVLHLPQLLPLITFFREPIQLCNQRAHALLVQMEKERIEDRVVEERERDKQGLAVGVGMGGEGMGIEQSQGVFDFKSSLDIEVEMNRSIICIPHKHLSNAKAGEKDVGDFRGYHSLHGNTMSALCMYTDMHYTHALRGFLQG